MNTRRDDAAYYELQQLRALALEIACPYCLAPSGEPCVRPGFKHDEHHEFLFHPRRLVAALAAAKSREDTPTP